jgi:hypothetical protein
MGANTGGASPVHLTFREEVKMANYYAAVTALIFAIVA